MGSSMVVGKLPIETQMTTAVGWLDYSKYGSSWNRLSHRTHSSGRGRPWK